MAFAPQDSSPAHHLHYQEPHDSTLSDDAGTTGPSAIGIPNDLGEERARNYKPTPSNLGYGTYEGRGLKSSAKLTDDGRILISLDLQRALLDLPKDYANPVKEYAVDTSALMSTPPMNVVIMIVGSRGDVQPYIAFGLAMQKYGHRVRIASHETFRKMVKDAKLEFYPIGGDPAELMSYMVKNPGLLPGFESLVNGDIPKKRRMLAEILDGCWKACYLADDETGQPFLADAIISNPPAFAHIHCAEALGIPLQLSFTMPWSATTAFHHPLVQVGSSNAEHGLTNYLSYALADLLQWQGLGDVINRYRTKTLGLEPLSLTSGPSVTDRLKIPWTYCFSPSLIPKPKDWMNHIDIVGFYFLEAGKTYTPGADLLDFLNQGDPPIYIGFGSVMVEDAPGMTRTIFDGVQKAGVRAIVSAVWGGLGGTDVPPNIFILPGHPGVPHDWLFTKVSAVCHHGGAGTTAIGLLLGKPTIVVPFFGDQPFWGRMVHEAGAGPTPIPQKKLNVDSLVDAIKFCLTPQARESAQRLADKIKNENGQEEGLKSFHAHLPLLNMRCDLDPSRVAVWWSTELCLKLSAFAAQVLADAGRLEWDDLDLHRPKEYDTKKQASDPVTDGASATFWTGTHFHNGIAQIFERIFSNPTKGIVNAMAAIPRGCAKIFESAYEGFRNMPKLYGSDVREVGPVRDFRSGLREGGKGFAYGIYDGITGLVTEPIRGAREEGFMGAIKGSGRSFINASMRPAAGTLALVAQPTRGLWKSAQRRFTRRHDIHLRESRRWEGHEATRKSPDLERESQAILQAFTRAKGTVKQRRDSARDEGKSSGGGLTLEGTVRSSSPEPMPPPSSSSPPALPPRPSGAVSSQTQAQMSVDGEEEAFQRDLELAIQLSRKEQEEYERALASIPSEGSTGPSELVTTGEDGLLK
ncbi:hypothetical protein FRB99_008829 [Tulasnella sp. 403]|nr:hypothetical protein FRB99_008829 [Tulasnella sp. 403]